MRKARAAVARRLLRQARWCGRLGSPLYEDLLGRAAADVEAGGESGSAAGRPRGRPARVGAAAALDGRDAPARPGRPGARAGGPLSLRGRRLATPPLDAGPRSSPRSSTRADGSSALSIARSDQRGRRARGSAGRLPARPRARRRAAAAAARGGSERRAQPALRPLPLRLGRGGARGDPQSPVRFEPLFAERRPRRGSRSPRCRSAAVATAARSTPPRREDRLTLLSYVWPDQLRPRRAVAAALGSGARVPGADRPTPTPASGRPRAVGAGDGHRDCRCSTPSCSPT